MNQDTKNLESPEEETTNPDAINPETADTAQPNPFDGEEAPPLVDHDTMTTLQADLEQALNKAEENWNRYLGAEAEIENLRKRMERDLQNAHKYALDKFANALLPVKDSLEMGVAAANDIVDVNKLREGSELTLKMLSGVMEKFGITEIDPLGEKFNPDFHEAMAMQPSEQAEPNTVLQVIQKGYLLNQRLIRPAMVIVAQSVK
jgi:molecular chaperone GrpE